MTLTRSPSAEAPGIGGKTSTSWEKGSPAAIEASARAAVARSSKANKAVRIASRGIEALSRQVLDGTIPTRHAADAASMVRAWTEVLRLASDEQHDVRDALAARLATMVGKQLSASHPTAVDVIDTGDVGTSAHSRTASPTT